MSTAKLKKVEGTFSERLKMLRKERGWSQEGLAARLDVSPGSVGNWEMGPYEPHAKTLTKLAALFEVEVRYLLRGDREEPGPGMRGQPLERKGVNLAELLREIEDTRDKLDRIAQQLKRAMVQPGGATVLTEAAATSYDLQRSGAEKSRAKEGADSAAPQTPARTETRHPK
jgi:transcriptional regulator with XRE-family HTH domain